MTDGTQPRNYAWVVHLLAVITMYTYYIYLWYDYLFYTGKAGWKGFELFTMTIITVPGYALFHVVAFFISRHNKYEKDKIISLAGLAAAILHVCAVAASM